MRSALAFDEGRPLNHISSIAEVWACRARSQVALESLSQLKLRHPARDMNHFVVLTHGRRHDHGKQPGAAARAEARERRTLPRGDGDDPAPGSRSAMSANRSRVQLVRTATG